MTWATKVHDTGNQSTLHGKPKYTAWEKPFKTANVEQVTSWPWWP